MRRKNKEGQYHQKAMKITNYEDRDEYDEVLDTL
jgi:hypothetical protein